MKMAEQPCVCTSENGVCPTNATGVISHCHTLPHTVSCYFHFDQTRQLPQQNHQCSACVKELLLHSHTVHWAELFVQLHSLASAVFCYRMFLLDGKTLNFAHIKHLLDHQNYLMQGFEVLNRGCLSDDD
jgi:hypothetical protein